MNYGKSLAEITSEYLNPATWEACRAAPPITPYLNDGKLGCYEPIDLVRMSVLRADPTEPVNVVVLRDGTLTLELLDDENQRPLGERLMAGEVRFWFDDCNDGEVMNLAKAAEVLEFARQAWYEERLGHLD